MARRAERDRQAAAELAAKKKAEIVEKERAKAAAAKKKADDQRAAARAAAEAESARDAALVYAYLDAAARDYPRPATYRRPKPKPEWDDSMVPTPIGRWDPDHAGELSQAVAAAAARAAEPRPARGGPGADSPRVRNVHTAPAKAGAHSADLLESFPFAAPRPHPSIPAAPPMPAPYYVRTYQ
ncbi:hypothetical protein JL720_9768 [Aureococcus anophagefferens]|nr:hypothetical protein JL720_9768 [Aureococcus anophagefferens]